ncbi:MAG TPA: V-type ATP synthase subunit D [Alphaproteobacteria bacterium]|nr:V-type ATP synthase subunit D [Alphaproteobacteria bacterium]
MPERMSPSRMILLAIKGQLALATQGRDLLQEKRNALMKEFMKIAERVMVSSDDLERVAAEARRTLAMAEAIEGSETVRSASFAARGEVSLAVEGANIMGVPVPVIEKKTVSRSVLDRGYSLIGTSARIDLVAERFEAELDLLLELAASEMCLRRLAEEIQSTGRRVNALENIFIPRLLDQRDYIGMILEEREREDIFRLKRVKQTLQRRKAG